MSLGIDWLPKDKRMLTVYALPKESVPSAEATELSALFEGNTDALHKSLLTRELE